MLVVVGVAMGVAYLCTAPILAQANMTETARGIIGMYMTTLSPFFIPWALNALAT